MWAIACATAPCGQTRAFIINGVDRSFCDREEVVYASARYMKQRHPKDLVEIRIRATGERIVMREDGRTG